MELQLVTIRSFSFWIEVSCVTGGYVIHWEQMCTFICTASPLHLTYNAPSVLLCLSKGKRGCKVVRNLPLIILQKSPYSGIHFPPLNNPDGLTNLFLQACKRDEGKGGWLMIIWIFCLWYWLLHQIFIFWGYDILFSILNWLQNSYCQRQAGSYCYIFC